MAVNASVRTAKKVLTNGRKIGGNEQEVSPLIYISVFFWGYIC